MDRRRLILAGAAGLASACASAGPVASPGPAGDDRLLFAQAHLELRPELAAQHFDCAVGARLTARPLPALTRAFEALADEVTARGPLEIALSTGPVCVRLFPGEGVQGGTSRRAALTVAYSLALQRMVPDRAPAIAARARDVAESEMLCGLADAGAIDRGRVAGSDAFIRLLTDSAAFRRSLFEAAAEVAQARSDPIESPACAAERRSLSPLPGAD